MAIAAGAVALLLLGGLIAWRSLGGHPGAGVFPDHTGTVLVFDDTPGGVIAVDLDTRVVSRLGVEGQRFGDHPWPLLVAGTSLVVGMGSIWAQPLDGGPAHILGAASFAIPSAQPGSVWLVTETVATTAPNVLTEVGESGSVTAQGTVPAGTSLWSGLGLASGVAYDSPSGAYLWDAGTQHAVRQFGGSSARVLGASPSTVAWCEGTCGKVHLTALSGHDQLVSVPAGEAHFESLALFSPGGSKVAIVAGGETEGPGAVTVFNTGTGAMEWVARQQIPGGASLTWSPDGKRLFAAWYDPGKKQTALVEYPLSGAGKGTVASLPLLPVDTTMVAVSAAAARGLIARQLGPAHRCGQPPPPGSPACGFGF